MFGAAIFEAMAKTFGGAPADQADQDMVARPGWRLWNFLGQHGLKGQDGRVAMPASTHLLRDLGEDVALVEQAQWVPSLGLQMPQHQARDLCIAELTAEPALPLANPPAPAKAAEKAGVEKPATALRLQDPVRPPARKGMGAGFAQPI